jgi:hypothetical protein
MKKTQEQIVYKLIKKKTNPYDSVVEVTGVVREITPRDVLREISDCEKYVREIEANVKIKEASMKNIQTSNPIVLRMGKEDLCACYLYYEAMAFNEEAKPKLEQFKEQIKTAKGFLEEIKKQTGLILESNEK